MGDTERGRTDAGAEGRAGPGPATAPSAAPTPPTDATAEFEEYTAPPRLDAQGRPVPRPRGLRAAGYEFPPPGGPQPPLTKANLAKGIGVPPISRPAPASRPPAPAPSTPPSAHPSSAAAPPRPPAVKVDEGEQFEEYRRPGLDAHPRTGKGIRSEPPPAPGEPGGPTAKDILAQAPEPDLQVFTPKRFSPYQVKASEEGRAAGTHAEHEKAALDAAADLAVHRKWLEAATMSSPAQGPIRAVIHHGAEGEGAPVEAAPAAPLEPPAPHPPEPAPPWAALPADATLAPSPVSTMATAPVIEPPRPSHVPYVPPAPATLVAPGRPGAAAPHASGAPPLSREGAAPRIALVQSDFHYDLTTRMAQAAHERARTLGAPIAHHVHVAGAFDIPLAAWTLLERDDVDAVVCVGAVVKGETGHDVLIARECARQLADLAVRVRKPVGLGVTGPDMTREQAWARVGAGAQAVESVVQQHRALRQLQA